MFGHIINYSSIHLELLTLLLAINSNSAIIIIPFDGFKAFPFELFIGLRLVECVNPSSSMCV